MRLYFFGPRIFGIRTGVSFSPKDFRGRSQSPYQYQTSATNGKPAFVYVTRADHGRCKIGITNNPNSRLLQLSTASAFPLSFTYIGVAESGDSSNVEREAHAILDRYRVNGEWFDCPPELAIAAINGAAARDWREYLSSRSITGRRVAYTSSSNKAAVEALYPILAMVLFCGISYFYLLEVFTSLLDVLADHLVS